MSVRRRVGEGQRLPTAGPVSPVAISTGHIDPGPSGGRGRAERKDSACVLPSPRPVRLDVVADTGRRFAARRMPDVQRLNAAQAPLVHAVVRLGLLCLTAAGWVGIGSERLRGRCVDDVPRPLSQEEGA